MSAFDLFEEVTSQIPPSMRINLAELVASQREELLAARSEEARVRIVNAFMKQMHELRVKPGHKG